MVDLILRYRECGAQCREDWLRMLACDNGLPIAEVQRAANRLGEREDFGRLIDFCGKSCYRDVRGPRCNTPLQTFASGLNANRISEVGHRHRFAFQSRSGAPSGK